jgi:plasmid stabilization system protein ParE
VMPSLPYIIVYHVRGDAVHIVRILHSSQDWP